MDFLALSVLFSAFVVVLAAAGTPILMTSACDYSLCQDDMRTAPEDDVTVTCRKLKSAKKCLEQKRRSCPPFDPKILLLKHELRALKAKARKTCSGANIEGARSVQAGNPIHLVCNITGPYEAPDSVAWYKDGLTHLEFGRFSEVVIDTTPVPGAPRTVTSKLDIKKSRTGDAGIYVCRAGRIYASVRVTVVKAPPLAAPAPLGPCQVRHCAEGVKRVENESSAVAKYHHCKKKQSVRQCLEHSLETCHDESMRIVVRSSLQSLEELNYCWDVTPECDVESLQKCHHSFITEFSVQAHEENCQELPEVISCIKAVDCELPEVSETVEEMEEMWNQSCKNHTVSESCDVTAFSKCAVSMETTGGDEDAQGSCQNVQQFLTCCQGLQCDEAKVGNYRVADLKAKQELTCADCVSFLSPGALSLTLATLLAYLAQN